MFKKTTFSNGLRAVSVPIANSEAVTVLALVNVGSKYEQAQKSGISHFLEHMFFKGTKKRPKAKLIAETLDSVGGSYNAFTSSEYTGYYAKVAASHLETAMEWVSDIFLHSTLPEKEIAKEKKVIIQEISMYKDHPTFHVQELWNNLLYGNQPAGRNIAGSKRTVSGISRRDLINYRSQNYVSRNSLICVSGAVNSNLIDRLVNKYFSKINQGKKPEKKPVIENQKEPNLFIEKRQIDQAHLCLGVRAYSLSNKDKYVLSVIETILGQMMSSRLFIKIREELGLAYYVRTEVEATTDSGFLVTQAGVNPRKIDQAVSAIINEYRKIAERKVSFPELEKAKENIKGRLVLGLETSDSQASFYGMQELLEKEIMTPEEVCKEIDKVSSSDILRVAKDIFRNDKINLAVLGPVEKELKKLLKF
jgi:predicted Zn-dependent peptidase